MNAEDVNLSEEYCPLFLARGMSIGDCVHGDPTDYKTCQTYQENMATKERWENRIIEYDENGKRTP